MKIDLNPRQSQVLQMFLNEFSEDTKKGIVLYQAENKHLYVTIYLEKNIKSAVINTIGSIFPYYVDANLSKKNEKRVTEFLGKMKKFRGDMTLEQFIENRNKST